MSGPAASGGAIAGSLNQKLDSALDVVREAMLREREAKQAERAERSDDATRAPALGRDR